MIPKPDDSSSLPRLGFWKKCDRFLIVAGILVEECGLLLHSELMLSIYSGLFKAVVLLTELLLQLKRLSRNPALFRVQCFRLVTLSERLLGHIREKLLIAHSTKMSLHIIWTWVQGKRRSLWTS